ncbi:hypothetical protein CPTAKMNP4_052 [Salmonella phage vB_SenM-AKM_NP4]|nr:hypothetical protein PJM34_0050 [Salmonella phage vB_SenM_UTK0003]WLI71677.1 hypothetical protein CPTAKMNP4_052 [Salmonella phage vB_SenM-AKM_NP4]
MKLHEFNLGNGWYGNIEYWPEDGGFKGIMFVTSECSLGVSWQEYFDVMHISEDFMLEYCRNYIRENNT